jgi:hypothetical protein
MTRGAPPAIYSPEIARELTRITGLPELSDEQVARAMAGAEAAIAALRAVATASLFDQEPGAYLLELERLASDPTT